MAFSDKYWTRRSGGTSYPISVPGSGEILMGDLLPITGPTDHLLRTFYAPQMRVHVGTTGIPTPLWWGACMVIALAWWHDGSDTTFYRQDSDYEGLLIAEPLEVRMQLDPASVGGYTVVWQPATGMLSCATGRAPNATVTDPVVSFGLQIEDPGVGIIGHLNSGTHTFAQDTEETLWGTPV